VDSQAPPSPAHAAAAVVLASASPYRTKWGLFLTVVPLTGLFATAQFGLHQLGWEPWAFDSLTGSLFGSTTFVIPFVLSGTHPDDDPNPLRLQLADLLQTTDDWLRNVSDLEVLEAELTNLNGTVSEVGRRCDTSTVNRCLGKLARIRILVTRMQVNRSTTFLGPAYAMLEMFLAAAVVALLLMGAERFSEGLMVSQQHTPGSRLLGRAS